LKETQRRILRGETPGTTSMGIIGVVSISTEEALRPYKEKSYYNEWEFYSEAAGGEDETPNQDVPNRSPDDPLPEDPIGGRN
jgi:hypothetical protein